MATKKRAKNWYEKSELKFVSCCYNCNFCDLTDQDDGYFCLSKDNNTTTSLKEGGRSIEPDNICKFCIESD